MEISILRALLNSITSFFNLLSCCNISTELNLKYYQSVEGILKLLNPILNCILEPEIPVDDKLKSSLLCLRQTVDELRDIFQSWQPLSSNANFVIVIEPLISKLRNSGVDLLEHLKESDHRYPDELNASSLEFYIDKIKHIGNQQAASLIKEAVKGQGDSRGPNAEILVKLADVLCLRTNQEILIEAVALEKLKENAEQAEKTVEVLFIDQMISLVTRMHDRLVQVKQSQTLDPVSIPPDFCCPLSLELMMDPVIVSSGQTYERAFIKNWIDLGLNVCPKTRQPLAHTNLIPNFTVKALIANWCETNNVKPPDPKKPINFTNMSAHAAVSESAPPKIFPQPKGNKSVSPASTPVRREGNSEVSTSASVIDFDALRLSGVGPDNFSSNDKDSELFPHHSGPLSTSNDDVASQALIRSSSASGVLNGSPDGVSINASESSDGDASSDGRAASAALNNPQRTEFQSRLGSRSQTLWRRPSDRLIPRIVSSSFTETRAELAGIEAQVQTLVEGLQSQSVDAQKAAVSQLRLLAKHNMDNRIIISNCGAIPPLIKLLRSEDLIIQQEAVTALLNLSINDNNKTAIANAGAIEPLIHVLETGTPEAKENAAATLFSLSVIEENKVTIGRSGAIGPLVDLLGNGTLRGKKDAATALFNLSICHENKARIVQAGAVRHLVDLMDPAAGMVDKAVAVLANLATIQEGKLQIVHDNGIRVLVEVVELGSARGKENAAAALLQLCTTNSRFCNMVLQEGAVPPLVALSQSGTPRAKEKAQTLLTYFRSQRHGNAGRG